MGLQPIVYLGRLVAVASREHFVLCADLDHRPPEDPERTFCLFMCLYARDVHAGVLPGPYTDVRARRYARACLIPTELAERPGLDVMRAARAIRVPAAELAIACAETRATRSS